MKKYLVRVNCSNFKDIEVEAESKIEAIGEALKKFNCSSVEGDVEFVRLTN